MFWSTPKLPVSPDGQEWIEDSLVWVREKYGEEFLKNVPVITPSTKYLDRKFDGSEEDAHFSLQKICEYMKVEPSLIKLTFYGQDGVALKDSLLHPVSVSEIPAGTDPQRPTGYTEICLDLNEIKDPLSLMATLIREVAQVKLLNEKFIVERNDGAGDITAVAFGFGIFLGNAFFKITSWEGAHNKHWSLNRKMSMPEPFIAYAMAWMAHYQGDTECLWTKFLNKPMQDDFKACREYIAKYPQKIRMERRPGMKDDWRDHKQEEEEVEEPVREVPEQYILPELEKEVPLPETAGKWTGRLVYGNLYTPYGIVGKELEFEMELSLTEDEDFVGTALDTNGFGTNPSQASLTGFTDDLNISFVKQYNQLQVFTLEGTIVQKKDKRGPEIFYSGIFNPKTGAYEGEWHMEASREEAAGNGTWWMKKIS
ncbi:MAG: hypothetical protein ACHQRM_14315 [Bacteroidia bacterium]